MFLSAKIEDEFIKAKLLEEFSNVPSQKIIDHELLLLDAVGYQLLYAHPYRPMRGFVEDLAVHLEREDKALPPEDRTAWSKQAQLNIDHLLTTEACLLHPAPAVAIGALIAAGREPRSYWCSVSVEWDSGS